MTKKIPVPPKHKISVRLSNEQWSDLSAQMKKSNGEINDGIKSDIECAISDYLTQHIGRQQWVAPASFSKRFKRIAKLSHELSLLIEDSFFPIDPQNPYFVYNEIIKRRISRVNPENEEPLIDERSKNKKNISGNVAERNEILRSAMSQWVNKFSISYFCESVDFEDMLRSVCEINSLFEDAVKHMPSAKGGMAIFISISLLCASCLLIGLLVEKPLPHRMRPRPS